MQEMRQLITRTATAMLRAPLQGAVTWPI